MKVINPVGRDVNTGVEAHASVLRACMCEWDEASFAAAKGSDGCFHCGCNCGMTNGNTQKATITIRKS